MIEIPSIIGLAGVVERRLTGPDYVVLGVYFAANLWIGWICLRRKQEGAGFFLGNGRVHWWAAGVSFFATGTSAISFMALPAKTYATDWLSFGSGPAQTFAVVTIAVIFVGLLRRLNVTTVFEYLERRFDRRVRLLGAAMGILLKIGGRMSVIMVLPAVALSTVTGLNVNVSILLMGFVTIVYSIEGGFEAVVWTDVLQVLVMFGGVFVALFFIMAQVPDGLEGVISKGIADGKFRMISLEWDISQPTVLVFLGMWAGSVFGQVADQPLMQRIFAARDVSAARRTLLVGAAIGLPSAIVFFFVGTALYVFYQEYPERLTSALPNDAIFPFFIVNELPPGVIGLIVAGLFAASMGSLSSSANSVAAIIVTDFGPWCRVKKLRGGELRLAKIATAAAGLIATGMALWIAGLGVTSLWDQFLKLVALLGGGFPGVFALGLLTRRASPIGAIAGVVASIAVTWWIQTYTSVSVFLHSFLAIAACVVVGYVTSLLIPDRKDRHLMGLVLRPIKPSS